MEPKVYVNSTTPMRFDLEFQFLSHVHKSSAAKMVPIPHKTAKSVRPGSSRCRGETALNLTRCTCNLIGILRLVVIEELLKVKCIYHLGDWIPSIQYLAVQQSVLYILNAFCLAEPTSLPISSSPGLDLFLQFGSVPIAPAPPCKEFLVPTIDPSSCVASPMINGLTAGDEVSSPSGKSTPRLCCPRSRHFTVIDMGGWARGCRLMYSNKPTSAAIARRKASSPCSRAHSEGFLSVRAPCYNNLVIPADR